MRRSARLVVAGVAAAIAFSASSGAWSQEAPGGTLYVTAGHVHTGTGEVFSPGAVAIQGGRVLAVGRVGDVEAPAGAERLEGGASSVVIPGLVGAWSEHLSAGGDDPKSLATDVYAIDGYDFAADERRLLAGGVTTVLVSPGSTQVVSGRAAVVKVAGSSAQTRTLARDAGLVGGVGDAVQTPPAVIEPPTQPDAATDPLLPHRRQLPVTRAGSLLLLRELFERGRGGDPAVEDVAAGRTPFLLGAESAGDIDASLELVAETGARAVLVGARDAHAAVPQLVASGLPVVLLWPGRPGLVSASNDPQTQRARARAATNPARLADAGVRFALSVARDDALHDLLFVVASAARNGLDPARALAAVTSDAAQILGVSDRVGALAPGRDGDLVLLSGAPHDLRSTPLATVVDGDVVWRRRVREGGGVTVVVRAAQVHVGDGSVFAPGEIAFEDGKIVEVGSTVGAPPGARLIDLGAGAVVPGFIDAFSHAGLAGAGGDSSMDLSTSLTAADAVDPGDEAFALLAAQGVTSVLAAPGGNGRVAGRAAVVKTSGDWPGARVVREDAGLVVRLRGEGDLAAAVSQLESALKKAKAYRAGFEKYEKALKEYEAWKKKREEAKQKAEAEAKKKAEEEKKKKKGEPRKEGEKEGEAKAPEEKKAEEKKSEPKKETAKGKPAKKAEKKEEEKEEPRKPKTDEALEGYASVLDKKAPVLVQAGSVAEIRAALELLSGEWKLRVVIVGGESARRLRPRIEKAKAGVIAGPRVLAADRGGPVNLLRALALSGLPAAVGSDSYLGGAELHDLLAYGVGKGLSPAAAVRLVTGDAAKLLGVSERVGTLEAGKDADLLLLSAPPFAAGSQVVHVFVGGEEVSRDAR